MSKKALIIGATGLVGKALVKLLIEKDHYDEIKIISRREVSMDNEKVKIVIVPDFDNLSEYKDQFNVHDVYCTIGTTRKKAGSKEAFLKVDLDYPLELAKLVMDQSDFQQFLIVTSLGANSDSPIFYNQTKGRVEDELTKLNMRALKIFQPSLLLGPRSEFRFLEETAKLVSRLFSFFVIGTKRRLWSIHDYEVAEAMYQVARKNKEGLKRYKPDKMLKLIKAW